MHIKDITDFKLSTQKKIFENKKEKGKNKKTYIKRLLNTLIKGGYHDSDPIPTRFLPYIKTAIERARKLDNLTEDFPTKLGTHVYKLGKIY
ncbi:MAG: hypothetical protein IPJ37_10855 [Bacteroidales bacterium]|nr:hypothetical protein [Bacteroidales bacterium]